MFSKLKQFKNMRDQAKKLQDELAEITVHNSWHNKINLVMDGNQKIVTLDIDPEMFSPDKKEELQKGIKECINDTVKKAQMAAARQMQSSGGLSGMNLPGMGG